MHPPGNTPIAPSTQPALELIGLAKLSPEQARKNLRTLLLANPNYFGNLTGSSFKAVLNIQEDTTYERIGFVGYNPQLEQILATINIKQENGYSGGICAPGSSEFLRFFLSYDAGLTWRDQGLRAVNVCDVPGPKPLEYAVSVTINSGEGTCFVHGLPRVRAILSWNFPPPAGDANWLPVWGNVAEASIQVESSRFILMDSLLSTNNHSLAEERAEVVEPDQVLETAFRNKLSPFELHMLYADSDVPEHRYLSSLLQKASAMPGLVIRQGGISKSTRRLASFSGISRVDLLSLVEKWLNTSDDTSYEQLRCVGLDPTANQLTGVVEIKQSRGYNGGPDTAGSNEYVAFWVDWGSGWEYSGATFVSVHDYSAIPAGGLCYSVFLPVDVPSHVKPKAKGALTARVRAVLSWSTRPSTTDPDAQVVWGNCVEATVLVAPGKPAYTGDLISAAIADGDMRVSKIGGTGIMSQAPACKTHETEPWRRSLTLNVWTRSGDRSECPPPEADGARRTGRAPSVLQ